MKTLTLSFQSYINIEFFFAKKKKHWGFHEKSAGCHFGVGTVRSEYSLWEIMYSLNYTQLKWKNGKEYKINIFIL